MREQSSPQPDSPQRKPRQRKPRQREPGQGDMFSGAWAAALATAGVAIGLGNVWRFPYMMGREGGGAFLLFYLFVVIVLGVPALMAEWALGRATRRGPWGAYQRAGLPLAKPVALLILLTIVMAASYYGVIVAQVLQDAVVYAGRAATGRATLGALAPAHWGWTAVFTAITIGLAAVVDALGVRRGVQRISAVCLPLAAVIFLALVARSLTLPGAGAGVRELFIPDFGRFTATTAMSATGQAFFSLALGGMFMVAYGARMRDDTPIPRTALATAGADVAAALLASLIVVPAALALGVELASGPSLLFTVMPGVFEATPFGDVVGAAFFFAIFLVALLSLIAAYEALAQALEDGLGWRRGQAMTLVVASQVLLSLVAVLAGDAYIGVSDLIWGTTMQPVGACFAVVALAWCVGRGRALEQLRRAESLPVPDWIIPYLRYVAPLAILSMLIFGWLAR